jgi:hypothetical protein
MDGDTKREDEEMKLERKIAAGHEIIASATRTPQKGYEIEMWQCSAGWMYLRVSRPVGTGGTVRDIRWYCLGHDSEVNQQVFESLREKAQS